MKKNKEELLIKKLLCSNKQYISCLKAIRNYSEEELWIGGGFIRTIIWDYQHHYDTPTEFIDIDVFYYQLACIVKEKDFEIERYLHTQIQNTRWSVKNQARMHMHHKDEKQYDSLEDALFKFPDTASTVAVRLDVKDNIIFIAPYGYNDLFDLKVKPTPTFLNNPDKMLRYRQRIIEKEWKIIWPKLDIEYL